MEVTALVRRAYRLIERLVIGVIVAVAVLVAVISLRLMSGPIDLDFLKPRIAQALDTAGGKLKVDAAHISLEWSGLSQPVNLVFKGIHVTDMEGKEVATAPSSSLVYERVIKIVDLTDGLVGVVGDAGRHTPSSPISRHMR